MPKTKISEFSATPGNNTDIDGINIAEGCAPSGINDAIRELMAQLKDFQAGTAGDSFNGPVGTTTAAAGAFTTLSATGVATFSSGTAGAPAITTTGDTNTGIFFPAADTVAASTGGTERLRLDSSGNLGLGVTPSAWVSNRKVLQVGGLASAVLALNGTSAVSEMYFNSYLNTSAVNTYAANGYAGLFDFNGSTAGGYTWKLAASGTAGNSITFTQAMTLDASGKLNLGVTSGNASFNIGGSGTVGIDFTNTGASATNAILGYYNNTYGALAVGDICVYAIGGRNVVLMADNATGVIKFSTSGNTERGRFTDGGDFLVGTTGTSTSAKGAQLRLDGLIAAVRDGSAPLVVNRLTNDGVLVSLQQATVEEGTISVSGTTVSYNGGHLARWSQLLNGQRDE